MKDKEKLSELLNKNPAYRNMDQKAIRVIEAVANTKIQVNEKEEKGNVCEGLQGIIDDAIQEEKKKPLSPVPSGLRIVHIPEFCRGTHIQLFEHPQECGQTGEAALQCNIQHWQVRIQQ